MAFIHCILFGFPSRQQAILRYEPKAHSAYGGKITFKTKDDGQVTVERVKGKSAGEVFIMLEDGRSGDDSIYFSEIIQGMDRTMYENIFSFNLHGLQEVHRLKDEEITRYLIAIGTLGTDKLFHTEQVLQKRIRSTI